MLLFLLKTIAKLWFYCYDIEVYFRQIFYCKTNLYIDKNVALRPVRRVTKGDKNDRI